VRYGLATHYITDEKIALLLSSAVECGIEMALAQHCIEAPYSTEMAN
jgi:hypothetical protein